jgi:hypothetical protein
MEFLAAIGIAANIFQVVDFCGGVISKANQYRKDGSTKEHFEIDYVVTDLQKLNENLKLSVKKSLTGAYLSVDEQVSSRSFPYNIDSRMRLNKRIP